MSNNPFFTVQHTRKRSTDSVSPHHNRTGHGALQRHFSVIAISNLNHRYHTLIAPLLGVNEKTDHALPTEVENLVKACQDAFTHHNWSSLQADLDKLENLIAEHQNSPYADELKERHSETAWGDVDKVEAVYDEWAEKMTYWRDEGRHGMPGLVSHLHEAKEAEMICEMIYGENGPESQAELDAYHQAVEHFKRCCQLPLAIEDYFEMNEILQKWIKTSRDAVRKTIVNQTYSPPVQITAHDEKAFTTEQVKHRDELHYRLARALHVGVQPDVVKMDYAECDGKRFACTKFYSHFKYGAPFTPQYAKHFIHLVDEFREEFEITEHVRSKRIATNEFIPPTLRSRSPTPTAPSEQHHAHSFAKRYNQPSSRRSNPFQLRSRYAV